MDTTALKKMQIGPAEENRYVFIAVDRVITMWEVHRGSYENTIVYYGSLRIVFFISIKIKNQQK